MALIQEHFLPSSTKAAIRLATTDSQVLIREYQQQQQQHDALHHHPQLHTRQVTFSRHPTTTIIDEERTGDFDLSMNNITNNNDDTTDDNPQRVRFMRRTTTSGSSVIPPMPTGLQRLHRQVATALMERPGAYSMRGSMLVERNERAPLTTAPLTNDLNDISARLEGSRRLAELNNNDVEMRSLFSDFDSEDDYTEYYFDKDEKFCLSWACGGWIWGCCCCFIAVLTIGLVVGLRYALKKPAPLYNTLGDYNNNNGDGDHSYKVTWKDVLSNCTQHGYFDHESQFSVAAKRNFMNLLNDTKIYDNNNNNSESQQHRCDNPHYLAAASIASSSSSPSRFYLAAFFFSLGGPKWFETTNWLSHEKHECQWVGVRCDDIDNGDDAASPKKIVVGITLTHNNLKGVLPATPAMPSSLKCLNLTNNAITSPLPRLPTLESLDLRSNSVEQSLVSVATAVPNATNLLLGEGNNNVHGKLDAETMRLFPQNLTILDLSGNRGIDGTLATEIGLFRNLQTLLLRTLPIGGTIPTELGLLTALEILQIEGSDYTGVFPESVWFLPNMRVLWMGELDVSLTIPEKAFEVSHQWEDIDIRYAWELSGSLPTTIGYLTNLSRFLVFQSNLNGE